MVLVQEYFGEEDVIHLDNLLEWLLGVGFISVCLIEVGFHTGVPFLVSLSLDFVEGLIHIGDEFFILSGQPQLQFIYIGVFEDIDELDDSGEANRSGSVSKNRV